MKLIATPSHWDCGFVTSFCVVYLVKSPQNLISQCNVTQHNRKLVYKVKCISQINGDLLLFFGNMRIRFFKINWLDFEQYGKNHYKKEHNQHNSVL